MRRKKRQLKVTIDIPNHYNSVEDFMLDLMDRMDDVAGDAWSISLGEDKEAATISNIKMADVEIGPEDEE